MSEARCLAAHSLVLASRGRQAASSRTPPYGTKMRARAPASLASHRHRGSPLCGSALGRSRPARTELRGARAQRLHVCASQQVQTPTIDDLQAVAKARGVELRLESFGPAFKVLCVSVSEPEAPPLGILEGFIAPPFKLLHLDSIRIFNSRIRGSARSRTQTPFGLSLLIGGMAFLYARDQGCTKAELLAIDDDNGYAERLVGYYRRLGFNPVRKVSGTDIADVPHMLVWGGVGTRMDANIPELVDKWARAVLSKKAPTDAAGGRAAGGESSSSGGSSS